MITGSYFPAIFYIFYCEKETAKLYISFMSILGVLCGFACFMRFFDVHKKLRVGVFLSTGLLGGIPFFHGLYKDYPESIQYPIFFSVPLQLVVYIFGILCYIKRFPEKQIPGWSPFSYPSSHNIWHCVVLVGSVLHWYGLLLTMECRTSVGCSMLVK